jgi:hypothetical protein
MLGGIKSNFLFLLSKGFELREPEPVYNAFFWGKNGDIHSENGWY